LEGEDFFQALFSKGEERLEFFAAKVVFFAARLNFDKATRTGHDDIHVDLGVAIFGVIQIKYDLIFEEADTDGGDGGTERIGGHAPCDLQAFNGSAQSEAGSGDGGGTGAAVGRENIAINPEATGSECGEIDHGAEATTEETLNLGGTPVDFAARGVASFATGGRSGKHGVFRSEPSPCDVLIFHPAGNGFVHAGGADHLGFAAAQKDRSDGVGGNIPSAG
jgi:hypothetical protein